MVDLMKCDHPMCVDGQVTYCEGLDAKGRPFREREEKCARCSGRGYDLPAHGFYLALVLNYGNDKHVWGVRVTDGGAEFTGADWDMTGDCKVVWLRKVAELDGSAPA